MKINVLLVVSILLIIGIGYAVVDFQSDLPFAIDYEYAVHQNCRFALQEYAVIKCDDAGITYRTVSSNDGVFTVDSADGKITIVEPLWCEGGFLGRCYPGLFQKMVGTTWIDECEETTNYITGLPSCNNHEIAVTAGTKLRVTSRGWWSSVTYARFQSAEKALFYADPLYGQSVQIPGTHGCIPHDLLKEIRNVGGGITEGKLNYAEVDEAKVAANVKQIGDTYSFVVGYRESVPVTIHEYNNKPVRCNYERKHVYYLDILNTWDNNCWLAEGNIAIDATGIPNFCCDTIQCQQFVGPDYVCNENFECELHGTDGKRCTTDAVCQPSSPFLSTDEGVEYRRYFCNDENRCENEFVNYVDCNPNINYGDNQICYCKEENGVMVCELDDRQEMIRDCRATFGTDACCLPTQDKYTIVEPPEGKECCYVIDGIGKIRDNCNPVGEGFLGIFGGVGGSFLNYILDSLGFPTILPSEMSNTILGILVFISMIIIIVWLLSIIFKGMFGRGVVGGTEKGVPVIYIKGKYGG